MPWLENRLLVVRGHRVREPQARQGICTKSEQATGPARILPARQANCRAYRHAHNKHGSGSRAHALVLSKVKHPTQDAEQRPADLEGRDDDEGREHPQALHGNVNHSMTQWWHI